MAQKPVIEDWEIGDLFGVRVIRGWIGGERVIAVYRYWSHGVFGVSRSDVWLEEKWKIGRPAPTAFDGLTPVRIQA